MSVVLGSNRFDIGGSADMGMVQMVTTGIAELLGIGRTQKFTDIMELMKSAFFNTRLTMFSVGAPDSTLGRIFNGSGFITVLLILSILLAAFLLGDKRMRVRTAWTALWSTLGFAAFYIFTGFTYVYVFKEELAYGLGDYNRYIYPYYAGWLVFAVTMLCASLKNAKPGSLARCSCWRCAEAAFGVRMHICSPSLRFWITRTAITRAAVCRWNRLRPRSTT